MARISERDLILPSLYIIAENPGISTSELIAELAQLLRPTGEDAEILPGRADTKFSQIVRNLVSHHTLDQDGEGFTEYEHRQGQGYHRITPKGFEFLRESKEAISYLFDSGLPYEAAAGGFADVAVAKDESKNLGVVPDGLQISEGATKHVSRKVVERSRLLREAAIRHYSEDGDIRCKACGFSFNRTYGEIGAGFIEMHHLVPLFQHEGQSDEQYLAEAIQGLVPLCSNCHRMVHRRTPNPYSVEELSGIIAENESHEP